MCSKDRDAAGNIAEPEGYIRRHYDDIIVIVGVIVWSRRVEAANVGAENVGGPGGAEVKEGEGTRKGAGESGEGAAEGRGEGGKDQAKGGEEAGEGGEEEGEKGSEGAAEGSRGSPS